MWVKLSRAGLSDELFSGHRVSLAPGASFQDSLEIDVPRMEYPGFIYSQVFLCSGRPRTLWREARVLGNVSLRIPVPQTVPDIPR
jgi:hypothetical protein